MRRRPLLLSLAILALSACDDGGPGPEDAGADAACDAGAETGAGKTLLTATTLAPVDDCDGSGRSTSGTLGGPTDAAWFVFRGRDTVGCAVDATVTTPTAGVRLCVFARCAVGKTVYKGCRDGEKTVLDGDTGCCGVEVVSLQHACDAGTTDDTADVYVRVDAPGAKACLSYSLGYHY